LIGDSMCDRPDRGCDSLRCPGSAVFSTTAGGRADEAIRYIEHWDLTVRKLEVGEYPRSFGVTAEQSKAAENLRESLEEVRPTRTTPSISSSPRPSRRRQLGRSSSGTSCRCRRSPRPAGGSCGRSQRGTPRPPPSGRSGRPRPRSWRRTASGGRTTSGTASRGSPPCSGTGTTTGPDTATRGTHPSHRSLGLPNLLQSFLGPFRISFLVALKLRLLCSRFALPSHFPFAPS